MPNLQRSHVLLVPYPSQGHINPMLQFARRLASYGPLTTLAITKSNFNSNPTQPKPGPVRLGFISDGFDQGGFDECGSLETYLARLESTGSQTLEDLIISERDAGRPVRVVIYDSALPWAADLGKRLGLTTASFFTQSCAVDIIYIHVLEKQLELPIRDATVEFAGLPRLELRDLPAYLPNKLQYPAYLALILRQFSNLENADEVLVNSFYELEPRETDYFASKFKARTIGPTVPSKYVDNGIPTDTHYGFDIFPLTDMPCMQWLDSKPPASVVYVSFGSIVSLSSEQMSELAFGLADSNCSFIWVVRPVDAGKVPENFLQLHCKDRGLIVTWCTQIEVLAHEAVGCFLTHCGWNSTLEGICVGVPMIGMPQWTDQTTDAKYVEDIWRVGVRVREDENGLVRREEIVRCVTEVMEGERSEEMRRNACQLKEMAKKAMQKDGSSDRNIVEFVAKYCS